MELYSPNYKREIIKGLLPLLDLNSHRCQITCHNVYINIDPNPHKVMNLRLLGEFKGAVFMYTPNPGIMMARAMGRMTLILTLKSIDNLLRFFIERSGVLRRPFLTVSSISI